MLPACHSGGQWKNIFLTVEADPKAEPSVSKERLSQALRSLCPGEIDSAFVSREVSETGYHHHHAAIKFHKEKRTTALVKGLQKLMHFKKANGSKVSVRAFHTRGGSDEDYGSLVSYITEKKYKESDPDPDGPLQVQACKCRHCGLRVCDLKVWRYGTRSKKQCSSMGHLGWLFLF